MDNVNVKAVPARKDANGTWILPPREPATRWITLKVPVYTTGHFGSNGDNTVLTTAEFTADQWTYIEKCALEHVMYMLSQQVEDLITPEVDFLPGPEIFPDFDDATNEEEKELIGDFRLEAAGTVLDILNSLVSEVEEEIGKRDI